MPRFPSNLATESGSVVPCRCLSHHVRRWTSPVPPPCTLMGARYLIAYEVGSCSSGPRVQFAAPPVPSAAAFGHRPPPNQSVIKRRGRLDPQPSPGDALLFTHLWTSIGRAPGFPRRLSSDSTKPTRSSAPCCRRSSTLSLQATAPSSPRSWPPVGRPPPSLLGDPAVQTWRTPSTSAESHPRNRHSACHIASGREAYYRPSIECPNQNRPMTSATKRNNATSITRTRQPPKLRAIAGLSRSASVLPERSRERAAASLTTRNHRGIPGVPGASSTSARGERSRARHSNSAGSSATGGADEGREMGARGARARAGGRARSAAGAAGAAGARRTTSPKRAPQ